MQIVIRALENMTRVMTQSCQVERALEEEESRETFMMMRMSQACKELGRQKK